MRCPECESDNVKVWLTRKNHEKNWVHRKRKCYSCGTSWSSTEIPDSDLTFLEEDEDGDNAGEESQD